MNEPTKQLSIFLHIVLIVFVLFAAIGCAAFFARFTNNFTSGFKTFYLEHDGKTISADTENFEMVMNQEYRFDVGYSLGFINQNEKLGYHVKIAPYITDKTNFDFTVNGKPYSYSGETDLTLYFDIKKYDDTFTIKSTMDLPDIFKMMYANKTLSGVPVTKDKGKDYFVLIVSSEDKTTAIRIAFNLRSM